MGSTNSILNDYQYDKDQIARIIDQYPHVRCLTGHKISLDLPFNRDHLKIQAFTWVRDPIDRFVSHYFFHRNHTTMVPQAKAMDLNEYTEWALKEQNQPMYINGQTKFLSGGDLEKIQRVVARGQLLIFPLKKLQESFFVLGHMFPDVFKDLKVRTKNVSEKDQVIPENFKERILPYVADDIQLLELAKKTPLKIDLPKPPNESAIRLGSGMRRRYSAKVGRFLHRLANYIETRG